MIGFTYNDGGRAAAGFKGSARDCVVRSIAIAFGRPYQEVYDALNGLAQNERERPGGRRRSSARTGVRSKTARQYLKSIGAKFIPTMSIGSGCRVHLRAAELPAGRLVAICSRHWTAVIDGVINDTYDPSRSGTRCVYGYFQKEA